MAGASVPIASLEEGLILPLRMRASRAYQPLGGFEVPPRAGVLDLFASGRSGQVLEELADLEADHIAACLLFASRRIDHPIVAA